ncbi:hypothetical protein FH972_021332 [Carpinus fangiana]|uniref:Ubiquitin-like domain-containing protein n=1 Tax=Carpinus fangiana TaxID=176857 RepID=A0A5N6KP21_9ROSI|nr:hypothetical protein FH972_021332 [Carpinus fangiana]
MSGIFKKRPWNRGLNYNVDDEDDDSGNNVEMFSRSHQLVKQRQIEMDNRKAHRRQQYLEDKGKGKEKVGARGVDRKQSPGDTTSKAIVDSIEDLKAASLAGNDDTPQSPPRKPRTVIALDDSDENDATQTTATQSPTKHKDQPATKATLADDDSDAEIRALAARRRAREAVAKGSGELSTPSTGAEASTSKDDATPATQATPTQPEQDPPAVSAAPLPSFVPTSKARSTSTDAAAGAQAEPTISILLHSRIPDTQPLIVKRLISQPLKMVRVGFCKFNKLPKEVEDSVFLTWRRHRLFDITTCRSIGIDVDASGEVYIKGDRLGSSYGNFGGGGGDDSDDDYGGAKVHMEVVTQAIFDDDKKALEARFGRRREASSPTSNAAVVAAKQPNGQDSMERRVKIILRSKGYEEYKLSVRLTTTFQQVVNVFRSQRNVPAEKEVFLMFDGDRLAGADTVDTSEIDDMDYIDVHVK